MAKPHVMHATISAVQVVQQVGRGDPTDFPSSGISGTVLKDSTGLVDHITVVDWFLMNVCSTLTRESLNVARKRESRNLRMFCYRFEPQFCLYKNHIDCTDDTFGVQED